MPKRLKYDAGRIAVYDYAAGDDLPLTDPLDHLDRVHFHSDLYYPTIVSKQTGTLSLPVRSSNVGPLLATHTLFAHGLSGQPLVLGRITSGLGQVVGLAGSVPVQISTYGYGRFLTLGSDATNVMLAELYHTHLTAGLSALDIDWEVWVTDLLLDQPSPLPTPTNEMLHISATEFRAGGGIFDAEKYYLRSVEDGDEIPIVQGKTIRIDLVNTTRPSFRYSVDGYVQQRTEQYGTGSPISLTELSFDAEFTPTSTE